MPRLNPILFAVYVVVAIALTVGAMLSPEVAGVTGKYFDNCKAKRSSGASFDVAAQQRLWELSEQMVREELAV